MALLDTYTPLFGVKQKVQKKGKAPLDSYDPLYMWKPKTWFPNLKTNKLSVGTGSEGASAAPASASPESVAQPETFYSPAQTIRTERQLEFQTASPEHPRSTSEPRPPVREQVRQALAETRKIPSSAEKVFAQPPASYTPSKAELEAFRQAFTQAVETARATEPRQRTPYQRALVNPSPSASDKKRLEEVEKFFRGEDVPAPPVPPTPTPQKPKSPAKPMTLRKPPTPMPVAIEPVVAMNPFGVAVPPKKGMPRARSVIPSFLAAAVEQQMNPDVVENINKEADDAYQQTIEEAEIGKNPEETKKFHIENAKRLGIVLSDKFNKSGSPNRRYNAEYYKALQVEQGPPRRGVRFKKSE